MVGERVAAIGEYRSLHLFTVVMMGIMSALKLLFTYALRSRRIWESKKKLETFSWSSTSLGIYIVFCNHLWRVYHFLRFSLFLFALFPLVQHMHVITLSLVWTVWSMLKSVCCNQVTRSQIRSRRLMVKEYVSGAKTFDLIYNKPLLVELAETPVTLKPLGLSVTLTNKEGN